MFQFQAQTEQILLIMKLFIIFTDRLKTSDTINEKPSIKSP
jgi:hypothetical protein